MPERLDRVTVTVPMGAHAISWDARETLLAMLEQKDIVAWLNQEALEVGLQSDAAAIRARFEAVGASRPVELTADEKTLLCYLLTYWFIENEGIPDSIEKELLALVSALERGDPSRNVVERWDAEEAEREPASRSMNWRWRWRRWNAADQLHSGGHDHCLFCNTRFSDRSVIDDDLDEGWCVLVENRHERWVCAGCFEKLHERFGWTVEPSPAS